MSKRKSYSFAYTNGGFKKDSTGNLIADLNRTLNLNDLDRLARERIAAKSQEGSLDSVHCETGSEHSVGFGSKTKLVPVELDVGELEITAF